MKFQQSVAAVFLVGLLFSAVVFAQTPDKPKPVSDSQTSIQNGAQNDDEGDPEVGPICPISKLLAGGVTTSDGKPLTATDFVVDLFDGRIVLVLARPASEPSLSTVVFPWRRVVRTKHGREGNIDLSLERLAAAGGSAETNVPEHVTREWLGKLAERLQLRSGGKETGNRWPDSAPVLKNESTYLVFWSRLKGTPVENTKQAILGKIEDLAVALPSGRVGYAALVETGASEKQARPVPLSAFVVQPGHQTWLLELPDPILKNTVVFSLREWPEVLDRGWVEYVHTRYGQPTFAGVGYEPHAEGAGSGDVRRK